MIAPADAHDPSVCRAFEAMLSADEHARRRSFVHARHRHEYLVTHALVRAVLSAHTGIDPRQLTFAESDYGRPFLSPSWGTLRFNVSNTQSLVACAVTSAREIGVDTEPLDRGDMILGLAETVFSNRELAELGALPTERRRRRAVELWTLKESYIKALGVGLSFPLKSFSMRFVAGVIGIEVEPPLVDARRWRFHVVEIADSLVSIAVEVRVDTRDTDGADDPSALSVRRLSAAAVAAATRRAL